MPAEAALEGGGLVAVVLLGAGAVRVDVVDDGPVQAGLVEGDPDRLGHLPAVLLQTGHVVGVAARGVAADLGVDVGAAPLGRLVLLQHEHRGALGEDEAVARAVEGPGGVCRVVVARAGRLDGVEAGDDDRRDRRVGGTRDDGVDGALPDELDPVPHGVQA